MTSTEHYMARMSEPPRFPWVAGKCPSCGGRSLFLGEGGYVTCSWIECADPTAITDLIEGAAS